MYLDTPLSEQATTLYLVLAGVTALIALLCAGVTVGLSAAEGRADLATLAALGAQPPRRRTLAGLVLGGLVGYAAIPLTGVLAIAIPWEFLLSTAVGVPLLSAAVAVLSTRSRLPMIIRRRS